MTLRDFDPTPSYLVFGATGGIGSELCRHLAAQGARLVLAGRNEEKLRARCPKNYAASPTHSMRATSRRSMPAWRERWSGKPDWTVSLAGAEGGRKDSAARAEGQARAGLVAKK